MKNKTTSIIFSLIIVTVAVMSIAMLTGCPDIGGIVIPSDPTNLVTIHWDANDGSDNTDWRLFVDDGHILQAVAPGSNRLGYDFMGWYYDDGTRFQTRAITSYDMGLRVTAHWRSNREFDDIDFIGFSGTPANLSLQWYVANRWASRGLWFLYNQQGARLTEGTFGSTYSNTFSFGFHNIGSFISEGYYTLKLMQRLDSSGRAIAHHYSQLSQFEFEVVHGLQIPAPTNIAMASTFRLHNAFHYRDIVWDNVPGNNGFNVEILDQNGNLVHESHSTISRVAVNSVIRELPQIEGYITVRVMTLAQTAWENWFGEYNILANKNIDSSWHEVTVAIRSGSHDVPQISVMGVGFAGMFQTNNITGYRAAARGLVECIMYPGEAFRNIPTNNFAIYCANGNRVLYFLNAVSAVITPNNLSPLPAGDFELHAWFEPRLSMLWAVRDGEIFFLTEQGEISTYSFVIERQQIATPTNVRLLEYENAIVWDRCEFANPQTFRFIDYAGRTAWQSSLGAVVGDNRIDFAEILGQGDLLPFWMREGGYFAVEVFALAYYSRDGYTLTFFEASAISQRIYIYLCIVLNRFFSI